MANLLTKENIFFYVWYDRDIAVAWYFSHVDDSGVYYYKYAHNPDIEPISCGKFNEIRLMSKGWKIREKSPLLDNYVDIKKLLVEEKIKTLYNRFQMRQTKKPSGSIKVNESQFRQYYSW